MLRDFVQGKTVLSSLKTNWGVRHALALSAILVVLLAEFVYMSRAPELVDEGANWKQIVIFLNRELSLKPGLNVIPGYHALIAAALMAFQKSGIYSARFLTTWISFASVIVFYLLTWKVYSRPSLMKTFQYAFFPLFFPFFSLIYTDILAMMLVLLAFYLVLWERYTLSGIVAVLSILARTNNIVWFAFLYFFIYYTNYGLNWRALPRSIRQTWVYWLGFGLFIVFVVTNEGVALTDQGMQPLENLHTGNVFYLLFLFAFLFLPLNLANIPKFLRLIVDKRWVVPAGLGAFLIYLLTFQSTHPYNHSHPDYFLRNQLLINITDAVSLKSAFFLPVAWSLLSLGVTRLQQKRFYWLYPFTLLSLLPIWLIEPRYAFVPLSLFLLFREEGSSLVERTTLAIYVITSIVLLPPLRSEMFFI
jgi:alpha-1,2-glucosyltransferase